MIEIGLVKFTPEDKIIDIYDLSGNVKAKYVIGKDAVYVYDLMSSEYVEFSFELPKAEAFDRGDHIIYEGSRYYITEEVEPEEVNSTKFKYTLRFNIEPMLGVDIEFYYLNQGLKESEWKLTEGASSFLQMVADNYNRYFGITEYKVGTVEPTEAKFIEFDKTNVLDALSQIAEAFECEWYISGRTINLVKKVSTGAEIDFENEVSVKSMEASNSNNKEKRITRLLALGSDRNIPANYRDTEPGEAVDGIYQKRLRIPEAKGDVIDAKENMNPVEVVEDTVLFEDVYPKRVGTIESVSTVEYTDTNEDTGEKTVWNAYRFTDPGIEFKQEYILPDQELRILFQSGNLNGFDFAVRFNPLDKPETDPGAQVYEIIRAEDYGTLLPNDTMKLKEGDQYVLYGFDISLVGDQYVPAAEEELYEAALDWLSENQKDVQVYECPAIVQYFFDNKLDLQIGQNIRLVNSRFKDGYRSSRIIGFEKPLINKYNAVYKVGDNVEVKRIKAVENEVKKQAEVIETNTNQSLQNRKNAIRNTQNLRALKGLIFDPDGYFDSSHIKPNSIETMYLAVGAKSQDFTVSGISVKTYKENTDYRVALSSGYINHRSLWWGGGTEKPAPGAPEYTWMVTDDLDQLLTDDEAVYYVYAKAEKQSDFAAWYVSTEQIPSDDLSYYYLLMGVIYPVNEERRDISLLNGMAYISGGTIYGDTIKSINYVEDETNEGSKYDLNNGSIRIGNKLKGLFFDSVNKIFKFFGVDLEFRNTDDEVVAKIDGESGAAQFSKGNAMFNADGSVAISGKIESNKDGNRIVVDPETRSLKFIDVNDKTGVSMSQFSEGGGVAHGRVIVYDTSNDSKITSVLWRQGYSATNNNNLTSVDVGALFANSDFGLHIGKQGENTAGSDVTAPRFFVQLNDNKLELFANYLPTDSGGLRSGQIWNDNGTLKIIT